MADIKTPYLNLQTDFGFKFVFGSLHNKRALVRFLNALFQGKLTVTDVTYHDKEILPPEKGGKRIVYDVYCTSSVKRSDSPFLTAYQAKDDKGGLQTDHHFILEMQNIYTPPFEERITFYASRMVSAQGKAGWDYTLEPVFAVAVTDFNFSHMSNKLVRDVMLVDRDTMEPLTDKVHILLCSLRELPGSWEECRTDIEQALFLIKNIDKMDNRSLAYREGNFAEIFEAARSSHLREDETIAYSQSLEKLRDTQKGILFAADRAREEGRAEGREKALCEAALKMLKAGLEPNFIQEMTGLSAEEIQNLS
ncbi:MAG: Rpn family recombination-promoting nuclease/putative transposase [Bacteroides sp.]|nr:Rpn family recombination-promoting nuclease/putative transposase [Bacteroides sp.]